MERLIIKRAALSNGNKKMEANEKKDGRLQKSKNFFEIFRNALYLTSSKTLIVVIIAVLTFATSSNALSVLMMYTENPAYIANIFKQGKSFDYESSVPFKAEISKVLDNVASYSLKYQNIKNFAGGETLALEIAKEEESQKELASNMYEILDYQIASGKVDKEYKENGFVSLKGGEYVINKANVKAYYAQKSNELIESYKRVSDDGYRQTVEYLEALKGVKFAVFDRNSGKVVSNLPLSTTKQVEEAFSNFVNNIIIYNANNPYYVASELIGYSDEIEEIAENYEQNFDIFVSFNSGLFFNNECLSMESTYLSLYSEAAEYIIAAAILFVIALAVTALLLCLSGRREPRGGGTKYALADKLSNEIHISLHLFIVASMMILIQDSVHLILNPEIAAGALFAVSTDFYIFRAEVCSTILVLFVLAAICCIKRHRLHGTLFTNTLIYKLCCIVKALNEH